MSPFFKNRHPRSELSAYIDGQMAPERATKIEAHLASCEGCGTELAQLRELRSALRAMPEVSAPRSFTLTPDQVAEAARPKYEGYRPGSMVTGLRLGSAGLAMALAVVVAIDAGGGTGGPGSNDGGSEMQALATESRPLDDSGMAGEGYEAERSPQVGAPDAVGTAGTTPAPNAIETPIAAGEDTIAEYSDDDSGGVDGQDSPAKAADAEVASDGDNDLLAIEITLGIAAALVLLASFFVAQSRKRST